MANQPSSILGGYAIKIHEAPYHLSYGDVCGAALIHKIWAITTAHCGKSLTYVRVGRTWRLEGYAVKILEHIVHPKYQLEHKFDYDAQLLKLFRALRFSKTVKPIRIGKNHDGSVFVSGWGYSKEKGEYNDTLQQVKVRIVSMESCQKVDQSWYNNTLTARMFCAGGWEYDTCQGDSGGGAASRRGELIGLSSFGYGCGRKMPGVYTNISDPEIREWILEITGV
ncbi:unnamed protein product [Arctia plantaginis]|uniref:Peptidase S1 domain-containing protein n=1 Tax=Arctia plantaginis TaxID=874455 RepID=A0A8S0ZK01_ARCPL|nr:unnamed protein product [Arctia plantaginis]